MFVSAKVHQALALDLARERARRELLEQQATQRQSLVEFLCARVNQLEVERTMLLKALTKIEFPIASIVAPQPSATLPMPVSIDDALNGAADLFQDMGDDRAKAEGVRWNPAGGVEYTREPVSP